MSVTDSPSRRVRFGAFEADLRTGELRKDGVKLKFGGQPFQVLAILLERPGEMVTREELQKRLWPDTFVDVERNLNTAINKIREVLGDSAETPQYIETLPRRGYRFIASVQRDVPAAVQESAENPMAEPAISRRPRKFRIVVLSGGVVLAIGFVVWIFLIRTAGTPRVVRFTQLTNDGRAKEGRLTTDGSRIYFTESLPDGRSLVAQVSVSGGEVVSLSVPLKQPQILDLSKDGTEFLIGNWEGNVGNSLWLQPVAGGSPRRVGSVLFIVNTNYGVNGAFASFGADATSIVYGNKNDIYSVRRDGSDNQKILTVQGDPIAFRFSPDGKVLRFSQFEAPSGIVTNFEAEGNGTGLRKLFEGCCGEWTPDGRFFIFQKRVGGGVNGRSDLWASQIERGFPWLKIEHKLTHLIAGPMEFGYPLPSKDGNKIFTVGFSRQAEVIRYDSRTGEFVPYLSGISAEGVAFSRDGQWAAYVSYPEGTLWRSKTDGSQRLQLTFPPMQASMPRWSPDGQQIAFNGTVPGTPWNIYLISNDGGTAQRVLPSNQGQLDVDWSPDGQSLIFGSVFDPSVPIKITDLKSRRASPLPGSVGLFSPHWSPDGKYISGTLINDPQALMLFEVSTQKWTKVCSAPVGYPIWSHDGKYLYFKYYSVPNSDYYRIVRLRLSDRKIENVAELGNVGRLTTGTFAEWFGLAPDDSPLFARDISTQEIYALEMQWP